MTDITPAISARRRELKRNQAIAVMAMGAILFVQAFFLSTEVGSNSHVVKNVIAIIGIVVLCVGAYFRPIKADAEGK